MLSIILIQYEIPLLLGTISGLIYTFKTTGFLSLYNGLSITLVGSIPKAGIRFGGNAYCKKLLAGKDGKLNMGQQFLAGMGAGTIEAILAVTPMETIKTKLIEVLSVELFCFLRFVFSILSIYYLAFYISYDQTLKACILLTGI